MRQYLKNEVFKVSKWVELFISAIIMIAVIGGTIYLVKDVVQFRSQARREKAQRSPFGFRSILRVRTHKDDAR